MAALKHTAANNDTIVNPDHRNEFSESLKSYEYVSGLTGFAWIMNSICYDGYVYIHNDSSLKKWFKSYLVIIINSFIG